MEKLGYESLSYSNKYKSLKSTSKSIAITIFFIKNTLKIKPNHYFPKDTKYANYIGAIINGIPMLNVHVQIADSVIRGDNDLYERAHAIEHLKEYMKNSSGYVMGDFNNGLYNTGNYCLELISGKSSEDACYKTQKCSDVYNSLLNNKYIDLLEINGEETVTFIPSKTKIDHVLTTEKSNNHKCDVLTDVLFSDHYPIILEIN